MHRRDLSSNKIAAARCRALLCFLSLAACATTAGDTEDEVAAASRAVQLAPHDAEAHCRLGESLMRRGQHEEAIASFRRTIDLEPRRAERLVCLGRALKEQGRLDEAIACCRRSIELDPEVSCAPEICARIQPLEAKR